MNKMPSEKSMKTSENRRSTKPIMEKRRRARINNSLAELKNLILVALNKDNARHSKLEKADILEMTVKHLQNMQRQQMAARSENDSSALSKFRAGFNECAREVGHYLSRVDGSDPSVHQRLLNHLADCLSGLNDRLTHPSGASYNMSSMHPVHIQVPSTPTTVATGSNKLYDSLRLVPYRLPTGEIAFLLPRDSLNNQFSKYSPAVSTALSSPVSLLGSSGILSPASSDRSESSPSPFTHTSTVSSSIPVFEPISPVPSYNLEKQESDTVWRPW
ncbi:transcription factor HES-4-like [Limulus polyphemus]|uniref:Transcription factor HES-4-like n=1 Tax=Limulus polyphemus TaxID=6850 RepID=A0ABM1BDQ9_LIMPO|nr:transcription factor HES-4-like [Limulus polyphemus]